MHLDSESLDQLPIELLEQVFDRMADVVFCIKDLEGRYLAVNQAFADRVGVDDKRELIGRRACDIFSTTLARTFEKQDASLLQTRRPVLDQLERIANVDGEMGWFLASKYPVLNPSGKLNGLIGISQNLHWPRDSELELANLRQLVEYIKENLDQPLRTDTLARQIELSAEQLDRRMKKVFRLSTKKFIMKCRLEKATRQLESTEMSIAAIALACGFADQSSFTRHFRSATSDTPASFRKNVNPLRT